MTGIEFEKAIRNKVFELLGPDTSDVADSLKPLLEQTLVRIIVRDLLPHARVIWDRDIVNLYYLHERITNGRNTLDHLTPDDAIDHVVDWLAWAARSNPAWLSRTNEAGNVRKLMKFGSIPAMVVEADKDIAKSSQHTSRVPDAPGTERVMDLADGYSVVRLRTVESLRAETSMMQHCVGLGGYDSRVLSEQNIIYSLRSRKGRSHATINVKTSGNALVELRGKQNRVPVPAYIRLLLPFLDLGKFEIPVATAIQLGIIVGEDDRHYIISEFPEHLAIRDLEIDDNFSSEDHTDNIDIGTLRRFSRNLLLDNACIASIPAGRKFPGNVSFRGSDLLSFPDGVHVAGDLDISWAKLSFTPNGRLPENLSVGGYLVMRTMRETIKVPGSTKVSGIAVDGSAIEFEDGFTLDGDLDLSGPRTRSDSGVKIMPNHVLGDGMTIKGDVLLAYSGITRLPRGLEIYGDLDITGTMITELPSDMVLHGNLTARKSKLCSLGGLNEFRGDVDLAQSNVALLPRGLSVAGSLDISETPVGSLPDDISVGMDLMVSNSMITTLPRNLEVPGTLGLGHTLVERLPKGLQAGLIALPRIETTKQEIYDPWLSGPAFQPVADTMSTLCPIPKSAARWCPILKGAARDVRAGGVSIGERTYAFDEIFVPGLFGRKIRKPGAGGIQV